MIGMKSGIDVLEMLERPDQKTGADDQHEGKGDLSDHEDVAEPAGACAGGETSSTFFQRFADLNPRQIQGGSDTEEHDAEQGEGAGKDEHVNINMDSSQPWNFGRTEFTDKFHEPDSQRYAETSCRGAEQCGLGQ